MKIIAFSHSLWDLCDKQKTYHSEDLKPGNHLLESNANSSQQVYKWTDEK